MIKLLNKLNHKLKLDKIIIYLIMVSNFLILFAYLPFYQEFQLFKNADNNYQLLRFDNIYYPRLKILSWSAFVLLITCKVGIDGPRKITEINVTDKIIVEPPPGEYPPP